MNILRIFIISLLFLSCNNNYDLDFGYIINKEFQLVKEKEAFNKIASFHIPLDEIECYSISYELDSSIIKVRVERAENYFSSSIANLKYNFTDEQSKLEFFLLMYSGSELEKPITFDKQVIEFLTKQNNNTYQGVYNSCRLLSLYAKYSLENSNDEIALAASSFSVSIIETFKGSNSIKNLKNTLYSELLTYIIKCNYESDSNNNFSVSANHILNQLEDNFISGFKGQKLMGYLELRRFNYEKRYTHLKKQEALAKTKEERFICYYNLANYFKSIKELSKSSEYFYKAYKEFNGFSCNINFFNLLIDHISFEKNPSKLQEFKNSLAGIKKCSERIQNTVYFLENIRNRNKIKSSQVEGFLKLRSIAELAFPNKSTIHLEDFYLLNAISILNEFRDKSFGKNLNQDSITISLFYDTRYKEQWRKKFSYKLDRSNEENEDRISQILLQHNNFKSITKLKNPEHKELFYLLAEAQSNSKTLKKEELNLVSLKEKLIDHNHVVINLLKGEDNYIYYIFDGQNLVLDTVDIYNIHNIYNRYLKNVKNANNNFDIVNNTLNNRIKSFIPDTSKKIIFIPDGLFVALPNEWIFDKGDNVERYDNINSYIKYGAKRFDILNTKINLFGFTDENTPKENYYRNFRELIFGYKELVEIKKILQLRDDQIKAGMAFDKTALLNTASNLIHISSHASSSMTNRFNNFILTRKKEEKLYGYELYNSNKLPKVVVLSACESGIGMHTFGAGVQTLSSAFLDNGTQTVIKTLWKVNEKSTAEFMIKMYTHWATGISLYDALEKTKDNFKYHDEYCAPYYWAGFVLEGSPNIYLEKEHE